MISIDIETYDPLLREAGPGVYRKDGFVVGFAYQDETGHAEYLNLAHPGVTEDIRAASLRKIEAILMSPEAKIGANIQYDLDWLCNGMGFSYNGAIHDVQYAEPLLDEYALSYKLDILGKKYLNEGKKGDVLLQWGRAHGDLDPISHMHLVPFSVAEEYALQDVNLPLKIFPRQKVLLENEKLYELYDMEIRLIPLLLQMRKNGVRIDTKKLDSTIGVIRKKLSSNTLAMFEQYGAFNFNSSRDVAEKLEELGVTLPLTEKGNPSAKKDVLEEVEHPIAEEILRIRALDKTLNTFLEGAFTEHCIDGRIHCEFYALRKDEGGTVSGRFSSQHPNLQQVPRPDEELGAYCREVFIPEEGHLWGKIDYSQIEYRVISHYARGSKAEEIREKYKNDPHTDYHQIIMDWTNVDRPTSKRLNFGMAYFMGARSMARKFHWSLEESEALVQRYHELVPFMRTTRNAVVTVGKERGYIVTILGRRARVSALMRENKKEYVLFNRLIQGGAADINKKAMVDAYESGLFNVLVPHLTVHDELGVSVPMKKEGVEAYKELKYCMENAVKISVPIIADAEIGPNWGKTEDCDFAKQMEALNA